MADIHAITTSHDTLDVKHTLAGKEVLVTGVTGFLGKIWVAQLLEELPEIGHIHLLIRSNRDGSALDRFTTIAEQSPVFRTLRGRFDIAGYEEFLRERVSVHDGDVSQPLCGLDESTVAELGKRLDAVVHFAGLTDFDPDPDHAIATNIDGAVHVADLVDRSKKAKLVHCSTCFVAGNVSGVVSETVDVGVSPNGKRFDPPALYERISTLCEGIDAQYDDPEVKAARVERVDAVRDVAKAYGWPNIYTFTKSLAEHLLLLRKAPVAIMRPAIVECSSHFPFAGWNEGVNTSAPLVWFISGPWQYLPVRAGNHFDIIPVDEVSKATTLIVSALVGGEAAQVYQLGSSQTNPLTFGRALELNNLAVRKHLKGSDRGFLDRMVRRFMDTRSRGFEESHALSVPSVKKMTRGFAKLLAHVDLSAVAPRQLAGLVDNLHGQRDFAVWHLQKVEKLLGKLEWMLDTYRPFIHDNDYIFATENIRALSDRLGDDDAGAWGWQLDEMSWRDYWIDTFWTGLETWTIPLLRGEEVPEDPPMERPLDLTGQTRRRQRARA